MYVFPKSARFQAAISNSRLQFLSTGFYVPEPCGTLFLEHQTTAQLLLQKRAIAADNDDGKRHSSLYIYIYIYRFWHNLRPLILHAGARLPVPRAHGNKAAAAEKRRLLLIMLLRNSRLVEMLA